MKHLVTLLALLTLPRGLEAQEPPRVVRAEPGFEIVLPHGWRVLPDTVLDALQQDPTAADIVLAPGQDLVLGLIPEDATVTDIARMPHPFVLFRTDRSHRISRSGLRRLTSSGPTSAELDHIGRLRDVGVFGREDFPSWDDDVEAAFSTFRLSGARGAIQAVTPYREGLLLTTYYHRRNANLFILMKGWLDELLINLRWARDLDPDAFQPEPPLGLRMNVQWGPSHAAGALLLGVCIGFLVGVARTRRRSRARPIG